MISEISMSLYAVTGKFKMKSSMRDFNQIIKAESAKHAAELAISRLGSKHGCLRRFVNIEKVELAKQQ